MDKFQVTLITASLGLEATLILLAVLKRRIGVCYSFFLFLVVDFISGIVLVYTLNRRFYIIQSLASDCIKLGIVLELNRKVFRYFPRVQSLNRTGLAGVVVLFLIYHWLTPQQQSDWWFSLYSDVHSKVLQAISVFVLLMVGSILYFRLLVARVHKFLLGGFLVSQLPVALGFAVMAAFGDDSRVLINFVNSVFFLLGLVIWHGVYLSSEQVSAANFHPQSRSISASPPK